MEELPELPAFLVRKPTSKNIELDKWSKREMVSHDIDQIKAVYPIVKDFKTDKGIKLSTIDLKVGGAEPAYNTVFGEDGKPIEVAYAFYSHWYKKNDDGRRFLKEYFAAIKSPVASIIDRIPVSALYSSTCWIARLKLRGCCIPDSSEIFFYEKIEEYKKIVEDLVDEIIEEKKPSPTSNPWSYFFIEFDELVDRVLDGSDESIRTAVLAKDPPKYVLEQIKNQYELELNEILLIGKDPQVTEAYRVVSKERINKLKTVFKEVIEVCSITSDNKSKIRRPRITKAKPAQVLVKDVTLALSEPETTIASLPPEKIVGASQVILYNINNRQFIIYRAEEGKTLTVKGKTIINFDEKKSEAKTLRKPKDTLLAMSQATKKGIERIFNDLSTKSTGGLSGRINDQFILFKAYI